MRKWQSSFTLKLLLKMRSSILVNGVIPLVMFVWRFHTVSWLFFFLLFIFFLLLLFTCDRCLVFKSNLDRFLDCKRYAWGAWSFRPLQCDWQPTACCGEHRQWTPQAVTRPRSGFHPRTTPPGRWGGWRGGTGTRRTASTPLMSTGANLRQSATLLLDKVMCACSARHQNGKNKNSSGINTEKWSDKNEP